MENWIEILRFTKSIENAWQWFFVLLDDEKIPHKEEIKEKWGGSTRQPKYEEEMIVYIPNEYKEKVETYLKEYNAPNNIVYEEADELKNAKNEDDEEKSEYQKRNIAQKILILTPFVMVGIAIICGIISSIIN